MRSFAFVFGSAVLLTALSACTEANGRFPGTGGASGMGGSAGTGGMAGSGGAAGNGGNGGVGGMVELCGNGNADPGEVCDGGLECGPNCLWNDGQPCASGDQCESGICDANEDPDVCEPADVCGNGAVDGMSESCDDGNTDNGDGCDAGCKLENGEACMDALQCASGFCNASSLCAPPPGCGNDVVDPGEVCDPEPACSANCKWNDGEQCTTGDDCESTVCDTTENPAVCEPVNTCGNGTAEGGETCDDGNVFSGDGCESDCSATPTAFRITFLELADPNVAVNAIANSTIADAIVTDGVAPNAPDGSLDLNILILAKPLEQSVPGNVVTQIIEGDCTPPSPGGSCSLAEGVPTPTFNAVNNTSSDCYTPDAIAMDGALPVNSVPAGTEGCFSTNGLNFTLVLGTLPIPLQNGRIFAQYDATPATSISGVLRGFLPADDSATAIIPAGVPLLGLQPLYFLFGVIGASTAPLDVGPDGTTPGWWVHTNFTATAVPWEGGATCGNGVVDGGEACDTGILGSCETTIADCDDGNACTDDRLINGDPCNPTCLNTIVGADGGTDGCCTPGGENVDPDCLAECGDGALGALEACDTSAGTSCDSLAACNDSNACTRDTLDPSTGPVNLRYVNECLSPTGSSVCANENAFETAECIATCGDGTVTAPETCDPASATACDSLTTCDDADPCTVDFLRKPAPQAFNTRNECRCPTGTCTACVNQPITLPDDGTDLCCPDDNALSSTGDPNCTP